MQVASEVMDGIKQCEEWSIGLMFDVHVDCVAIDFLTDSNGWLVEGTGSTAEIKRKYMCLQ
jgi:hypothetical protein